MTSPRHDDDDRREEIRRKVRVEIRRRQAQEIHSPQGLQAALDEIVTDVRLTSHPTEVSFDFKLPVAVNAPFSSSLTYDPDDNTITGVALRFSPEVLERVPDQRIRDRLEGIIDQTDPPGGTVWGTYIRGDAQITGPHILAPGGFSEVAPEAFIDWLPRVLEAWERAFE